MNETQLYEPVKNLFETLGFSVHAEVHDMDVVATKEDSMVVIELKTSFNLKLVLQAIMRQKLTNDVYVAIPRPSSKLSRGRAFQEKEHLLRRLELGLILVALDAKTPYAQIAFDPQPFSRTLSQAKNKKKKERALKELSERHGDNNIGGTNGKLITAYREKALVVVNLLKENGEMALKDIRVKSGNEKVQTLFANNHYGWFERVRTGIYQLSEDGHKAYEDYLHIINFIK